LKTGCNATLVFLAALALAQPALGQSSAVPEPASYKFTAGQYAFSSASTGWDFNLRRSSAVGNLWVGLFQWPQQDVSQWRAGWDNTYGTALRITPSIQYASGGFWGGSIQAEVGHPWFASVGFGRTNLRPYFNLNFDPNDSYSLSFGRRSESHQLWMVQYVRDNRDNPDQQHLHLIYRTPVGEHERLTVDLLYKTGLVNGAMIYRTGLTVGYDWPRYFVKLAFDPRVNFTTDNVIRVSAGLRF
jgi:hypothetical protein